MHTVEINELGDRYTGLQSWLQVRHSADCPGATTMMTTTMVVMTVMEMMVTVVMVAVMRVKVRTMVVLG